MRWVVVVPLVWCVGAVADDDFGRLFSTPIERQSIDRARESGALPVSTSAPAVEAVIKSEVAKTNAGSIVLKGVVIREHGSSVAWINNKSTLSAPVAADDFQIDRKLISKDGTTLVVGGKTIQLKPGQVYDQESGSTRELYQSRAPMPLPKVVVDAPVGLDASNTPNREQHM